MSLSTFLSILFLLIVILFRRIMIMFKLDYFPEACEEVEDEEA